MSTTLPAIFFGHGNPMNAIGDNAYTRAWAQFGRAVGKPRAVLSISAHWYVPEVGVTVGTAPRTIHDFGGFPRELYAIEYPAPGDAALVERTIGLLAPLAVRRDDRWGLDHGTWSVLRHVFPQADVPVVQLAIDRRRPPRFHFEIGQRLAPLREEGVLIVGSGNVVHNLPLMDFAADAPPYDWALRFDARVRDALCDGRARDLIDYPALGSDALLAAPTPDHYLPLLYVLGAAQSGDAVSFPVEGLAHRAISMRAIQIGAIG